MYRRESSFKAAPVIFSFVPLEGKKPKEAKLVNTMGTVLVYNILATSLIRQRKFRLQLTCLGGIEWA
uniref:Uncharacterized protein n=1 Tax=Glossina palpalis gambiensis TaxID=67801 RepID=A0A1B0B335_9MUSC